MNRSLAAKSSARLAAVQLLYQVAVTGTKADAEKLAEEYAHFTEGHEDAKEARLPHVPPDKAYLKKLLRGVIAHEAALEAHVGRALSAEWKKERMSPLMLSLLRAAAFELAEGKPAAPVVVDEYASLAARFFNEADTAFVHAALQNMAKNLRS